MHEPVFIGHSLGQYSALCAAKIIHFEDAAKILVRNSFKLRYFTLFIEREG